MKQFSAVQRKHEVATIALPVYVYWWFFLKCLCQPPLVSNWARGCWGTWVEDRCYGILPFTVNPHRPVKPIRCWALTWLTTGWSGMHCTPSWLQGIVAGIMSVTMPLLNVIDLVVAAFHQSRTCWRWQSVWRERVELLIKLFGRWFWEIVQQCFQTPPLAV